MAAPLIPWQPCNIPEEIQAELNRRKINRSFTYVAGERGGWENETGDWNKYRGPMSPWIRVCSNGIGRQFQTDKDGNILVDSKNHPIPLDSSKIKKGFIFYGGKNFYNQYGFGLKDGDPSIIGYVPDGKNTPHTIDNDLLTSDYPIYCPSPEIERIQVTIQKEYYRRATIEWTCFSKKQLEYMTPYFLVPGITCLAEWGWNHFDPMSLVDLTNETQLQRLFHNPYPLYTEHIMKSRGNYDVIFGIITHFEWAIEGNKIKCKTEITSKDRIYAGLVIDSSPIQINKNDESETPLGKLTEFVDKILTQFKAVSSNKNPESVPQLTEFITYLKSKHPTNWKDYAYGIFYGRDMEDSTSIFQQGANKKEDFDYKNGKNKELWLNLGLVIEAINFHSAPLTGMQGKEMFRVDIDDVVIGGHPNLISSDGTICLIPNSEAPKYFYGLYGPTLTKSSNYNPDDWERLKTSTNSVIRVTKKSDAEKRGKLADYKVYSLCLQSTGCHRDDLDELINRIRYQNGVGRGDTYEFPFNYDRNVVENSKPYPARYSGYLKNIYVNLTFLKSLLSKSDEIKTYPKFIEKILEGINSACGNFWDFRLVDATGAYNVDGNEIATMKIVDYKFMAFANRGSVYTFDYMDSDSLLQSLAFKPTLSNAQAIRTIYSEANNPSKPIVLTNGTNELLDYRFKDRLISASDSSGALPKTIRNNETFKETMRGLQQIDPSKGSYQITNLQGGKTIVRRLVLPDSEILQMLLDDGDEKNNPKYTGIMPGIQAQFTIQGVGGLRTFMMFLVRNLPEPYSHKNIVFRIVDVQETIESGKWVTTIVAGIVPLRDWIKTRLGVG